MTAAEALPTEDGRTRQRVLSAVLDHGPISASSLAKMMGLTAAAIRRHLDALTDDGLIEVRALAGQRAGRGRPARHYTVTSAGHAQISHTYDGFAVDVLEYVKDAAGPGARRGLRPAAYGSSAGAPARSSARLPAGRPGGGDRRGALASARPGAGSGGLRRIGDTGRGRYADGGDAALPGSLPHQECRRALPRILRSGARGAVRVRRRRCVPTVDPCGGAHVCTAHPHVRTGSSSSASRARTPDKEVHGDRHRRDQQDPRAQPRAQGHRVPTSTAGTTRTRPARPRSAVSARTSSGTSPRSRTSRTGCRQRRLKALKLFREEAHAVVGCRPVRHQLR